MLVCVKREQERWVPLQGEDRELGLEAAGWKR